MSQLGPEGLAFIETFQPTLDVPLGEENELLAFHGSSSSYDDVVLPHLDEEEFRRLLGPPRAAFMAGGHVHLQWLRRHGATTFVNPGSVGLSYDHAQPEDALRLDAFAAYARIDFDERRIEVAFRRVPFDRGAVLAAIAASGIPHADMLATEWRSI
jgi:diadenosine tetraphosphatase ApaH/serine/threonine PP2A family protein phosphatase